MTAGKTRKAAVTVEAALLMTLIIPLLIAIMVTGFYVHDRAYVQGVCTELCAMGSNLQLYDDAAAQLDVLESKRLSGSMMWTKAVSGSHDVSETAADASAHGSFNLPGLITNVFGMNVPEISASWSRNIYHPAELIWTMRSVKYVVDLLRE